MTAWKSGSSEGGSSLVASTFLKDTIKTEGVLDTSGNRAFFEGIGTVSMTGPYATKVQATPPAAARFSFAAREDIRVKRRAPRRSSRRWPRAYRRPINKEEIPWLMVPVQVGQGDTEVLKTESGSPSENSCVADFLFRVEIDPAKCSQVRPIVSATRSLLRGCRSSSGAAVPTRSFWVWPSAGN